MPKQDKPPCLNCIEREPACHSKCEIGIAWDKAETEKRNVAKKNAEKEYIVNNFKIGQMMASKKKAKVRW